MAAGLVIETTAGHTRLGQTALARIALEGPS